MIENTDENEKIADEDDKMAAKLSEKRQPGGQVRQRIDEVSFQPMSACSNAVSYNRCTALSSDFANHAA